MTHITLFSNTSFPNIINIISCERLSYSVLHDNPRQHRGHIELLSNQVIMHES